MPSRITLDSEGDVLLQMPYQPPPPPPILEPLPVPDSEIPIGNSDKTPYIADKPHAVDEKINETRELLVSSKILSLASLVYRTMLYGKLSEGVAFSTAKNSDDPLPFQLSLPEDDAEAMTLLCEILHFAISDIPELPSPESLEKLAVTCDKYQCIPALKYCGGIWVRNRLLQYENAVPEIDELCCLFVFAYVADLEFEFVEVAWKLLLHHKGPFTKPGTQAVILIGHPLLYQDVGSRLDSKRSEFCEEYHHAAMGPFMIWNWGSLTQGCCRVATAIASLLKSNHVYKRPHGVCSAPICLQRAKPSRIDRPNRRQLMSPSGKPDFRTGYWTRALTSEADY